MSDTYDFSNLSPIEFEGLCVDLLEAETGLRFERFSEGADDGIDGRYSRADENIIIQAKHYKNSSWNSLFTNIKKEKENIDRLNPSSYYLITSQPLSPARKSSIVFALDHASVTTGSIWGRAELNAYIRKHDIVEKKNIKLWLSSSAVLQRMLLNDIAVYTEATISGLDRILKVFVTNPSYSASLRTLERSQCLIISGPPGVGKTTLAQVLAASYMRDGWELISVTSIAEGWRAFQNDKKQIFVFDDFLGKIRLDPASLAQDDSKIVRFMSAIRRLKNKLFILTTRAYILQAAKMISEVLDDEAVEISEITLDLDCYTRELKARILYNHLYHSELSEKTIGCLIKSRNLKNIIDHPNYIPRIIQWMTDEFRVRKTPAEEYPELFIKALDNPAKLWEKAFNDHISAESQVLLYCIFLLREERYYIRGATLSSTTQLFENAVIEFNIINKESIREDTIRKSISELKSSFIVVDGSRINFINPSVQDFLYEKIRDKYVLSLMARSVVRIEDAKAIWEKLLPTAERAVKTTIANILLCSLYSGRLTGLPPLHEVSFLIGQMLNHVHVETHRENLVTWMKKTPYRVIESQLPALIDELEVGLFQHYKDAALYARYLRFCLHRRFLDSESDIDFEELGTLCRNLYSSKIEMSDVFWQGFESIVTENAYSISDHHPNFDDDGQNIAMELIEHIDNIQLICPIPSLASARATLEDWLCEFEQRNEDEYREVAHKLWSKEGENQSYFSDEDIILMFSSLSSR